MICRAMTEGLRTRVLILAGVVIETNSSRVAYLSFLSCCYSIMDYYRYCTPPSRTMAFLL
jgi:hypothetical protein